MARRNEVLADLQDRIGHRFADPGLLEEAVTHASANRGGSGAAHNERLEFLGDRVLGLLAAETLVARDPSWREGELSRRLAALVSGPPCAAAAREIDLGPALRLAVGGRENPRILGDAMEALIAAVYLDGGLVAARRLFERAWRDALAAPAGEPPRDPKTALQEWAMAQALPLPLYRIESRAGPDHAPLFTVKVTVAGYPPATGAGGSVQAAEKTAAQELLARNRAAS